MTCRSLKEYVQLRRVKDLHAAQNISMKLNSQWNLGYQSMRRPWCWLITSLSHSCCPWKSGCWLRSFRAPWTDKVESHSPRSWRIAFSPNGCPCSFVIFWIWTSPSLLISHPSLCALTLEPLFLSGRTLALSASGGRTWWFYELSNMKSESSPGWRILNIGITRWSFNTSSAFFQYPSPFFPGLITT